MADVPAGTGMGSSGAFTVCLLKALAHARCTSITPGALAEAACHIEIDVLKEPVGKQDQYVAAHGGICAYTFRRDGSVDVEPLELDTEVLRKTEGPTAALLHRAMSALHRVVLSDQDSRSTGGRSDACIENLQRTKAIGYESRELLLKGDLDRVRRC